MPSHAAAAMLLTCHRPYFLKTVFCLDLLQKLYRTYLPDPLPHCQAAAHAFCAAICPNSQSSYLLFPEQEADWLLERLAQQGPYGIAMFSGGVLETFNHLLKIAAVLRSQRPSTSHGQSCAMGSLFGRV